MWAADVIDSLDLPDLKKKTNLRLAQNEDHRSCEIYLRSSNERKARKIQAWRVIGM